MDENKDQNNNQDSNAQENQDQNKEGENKDTQEEELNIDEPFLGDEEETKDDKKPEEKDKGKKEDEEDIDDEDAKLIDKRVEQKLAERDAANKAQAEAESKKNAKINERKSELDTFFSSEDGKPFKQFEEKIRNYAMSSHLLNVKIDNAIAAVVGTKNLIKIGAKLAKEADRETTESNTGGNPKPRVTPTGTDPWKMSPDEFQAVQDKVRRGETVEIK